MTIGAILNGKGGEVVTIGPDAAVSEALALLHRHRVGAVLVMDGARVAGVLSERDIVRGLYELGPGVVDRAVSSCMTAPVVTVGPGDSVEAALALMTLRRFRHLPVLRDGKLVGLVSIGDLVKQRIDDAEHETAALRDYIVS